MLSPNQKIRVSWHNLTRKHYEDKGYQFTKYRDYFYVDAEDLSCGCHAKVKVICDYCGKEFEKHYANYLREHDNGKDCCADCQPKKNSEICMMKYGVSNGSQTIQAKTKSQQTFMEHYGVDNPMKSQTIKDKMIEMCQEKYGVSYYTETEEFKKKSQDTFLEKYGTTNPFGSDIIQEKIKETCMNKYGVEYTGAVPEVRTKMRLSMYKNGTVPVSEVELNMCETLKQIYGSECCFPSYPYQDIILDCLLSIQGYNIDIEYDGWYWHKNKMENDKRRNYFLIRRGFKVIRFRGNTAIPTKQDIIEAVDYIVKGNHSLYIKDLEELDI